MSDIKLGVLARDKISGFEGTINRRMIFSDGSVQFAIQPRVEKDKAGEHKKAVTFDMAQIEVIGAGPGLVVQPYLEDVKINLGEQVEDVATGLKGIAWVRHDFINGCVYFEVKPKMGKDGKLPDAELIEHFTLKKIGLGITKLMPKVKADLVKKSATPAPRSGGPSIELDNNYARER